MFSASPPYTLAIKAGLPQQEKALGLDLPWACAPDSRLAFQASAHVLEFRRKFEREIEVFAEFFQSGFF